jgi:hypothetical protein
LEKINTKFNKNVIKEIRDKLKLLKHRWSIVKKEKQRWSLWDLK